MQSRPNDPLRPETRARLRDIDRAKGLAIFLVVMGHVVAREVPWGAEWYVSLKAAIYTFHMDFFMFLAGLILGYTGRLPKTKAEYRAFLARRVGRLLPAYFLFGTLVFFGKWISQSFVHIDNGVRSWGDWFMIAVCPRRSVCHFLWFIYVLFMCYAIVPVLLRISRQRLRFWLAAALVLRFIPLTDYFALNHFRISLFAFLTGLWAGRHYPSYEKEVDRWRIAAWAAFAAALPFAPSLGQDNLAMGALSVPALHALARLKIWERWRWLETWGVYTFPIYLMNTMAIGAVKAVCLKFAPWDKTNFIWMFPVLLFSGILLPIAAKRLVLRRIPVLDRITR